MGRRPKSDAIRRAHQTSQAVVIPDSSLPMPDYIADNDTMRECWEWTVETASHFTEQHVPALATYVYWWATARQCMENLSLPGGAIITQDSTPMGDKQHPDIRTLQLATNQMRQLSAELGISPLANARMNLQRAATMTLAADLPDKIRRILDEKHGD